MSPEVSGEPGGLGQRGSRTQSQAHLLPPVLHLSGLSYSNMSFYFGHPNEDQVAYITHFRKEDVEEKE